MELRFERGRKDAPKGHAFVYFRAAGEPNGVLATYVIVLPLELDIAKYMPPMFASGMNGMSMQAPSVVPMPPVPEPLADAASLERMARLRDDDIIDGGMIYDSRPDHLIGVVGQIASEYESLYNTYLESASAPAPPAIEAQSMPAEDDEYAHLGEGQKVEELAKLAGLLRYSTEIDDQFLQDETARRIRQIGSHLPSRYRIEELIEAARTEGDLGKRLCELQIERCYKLRSEEYSELADIELRIKQLRRERQ
jgi:hypothetical protein